MAGKHISYSEWKNWHICPHYHKLTYIDKVKQFEGNIFTAFGKAIHTVCELTLTSPKKYRGPGVIDALVRDQFLKELKALGLLSFEEAHEPHVDVLEMLDVGIL